MILKRQVTLKALVPERLKQHLPQAVEDAIQRVDESQDELDRRSRRVRSSKPCSPNRPPEHHDEPPPS